MTKEEILDKAIHLDGDDQCDKTFVLSKRPKILEAMDEYAMQDSIGYLNWYLGGEWNFCDQENGVNTFIRGHIDNPDACEICTESELYQLYLNSKK